MLPLLALLALLAFICQELYGKNLREDQGTLLVKTRRQDIFDTLVITEKHTLPSLPQEGLPGFTYSSLFCIAIMVISTTFSTRF